MCQTAIRGPRQQAIRGNGGLTLLCETGAKVVRLPGLEAQIVCIAAKRKGVLSPTLWRARKFQC